jgi:hypothetical protein
VKFDRFTECRIKLESETGRSPWGNVTDRVVDEILALNRCIGVSMQENGDRMALPAINYNFYRF